VRGGEAAGKLKRVLQQLGLDPAIIRRAAIAAYEAEMNIVIHS
jgi:anti-sigma regulatory factor (Ser/Thr protein kinase)